MTRVLSKRLLREFKQHIGRYLALLFLIMFVVYVVVSMAGAAETIIHGSDKNLIESNCEDGEFTVFFPYTQEQEDSLKNDGISLERTFYCDFKVKAGNADDTAESTLRVMKNRKEINLVQLDEGTAASNKGEAVIEKRYASENGIKTGDTITVAGKELKITGIGSVTDYDFPVKTRTDVVADSKMFGLLFVSDDEYDELKASGNQTEAYNYTFKLNNAMSSQQLKEKLQNIQFDYKQVNDVFYKESLADTVGKKDEFLDGLKKLKNGSEDLNKALKELSDAGDDIKEVLSEDLEELNEIITEYIDSVDSVYKADNELNSGIIRINDEINASIDKIVKVKLNNLLDYVDSDNNPRVEGAKGDILLYRSAGLFAGVIGLMLFAYVMSVFVLNQINAECGIIGAFYAMGVKKRTLLMHYITLPVIISFVGGLLGLGLAYSPVGIGLQLSDSFSYYSIPHFKNVYSAYLIVYACIMPVIIAFLVNYLTINKKLSQTALSLIKNEQKAGRTKHRNYRIKSFILNYQIRQTIKEIRTALAVIIGMFISMVILMLGMNEYAVCHNQEQATIEQTKYQYMYSLKYKPKTVPEGATPYIMENLTMNKYDYNTEINVVGIGDSDPYYGGLHIDKSKSDIVVSRAFASKYALSEGDKFILSDKVTGTNYAFTIADIADYSADLSVFMNIDSMRDLFGYEKDDYNILLSDKQLDIEQGRLYSITTYNDVKRSAQIVADMMNMLINILVGTSGMVLIIVMYLMMNVMVDRAKFGVSLVKVFGFRVKEIKRMYLTTHRLIIYLSIAIGLPLAKLINNKLLPMIFASVSSGIDTSLPWYYYAAIVLGILIIHEIINISLVRKISKITPAEVLKHRE